MEHDKAKREGRAARFKMRCRHKVSPTERHSAQRTAEKERGTLTLQQLQLSQTESKYLERVINSPSIEYSVLQNQDINSSQFGLQTENAWHN